MDGPFGRRGKKSKHALAAFVLLALALGLSAAPPASAQLSVVFSPGGTPDPDRLTVQLGGTINLDASADPFFLGFRWFSSPRGVGTFSDDRAAVITWTAPATMPADPVIRISFLGFFDELSLSITLIDGPPPELTGLTGTFGGAVTEDGAASATGMVQGTEADGTAIPGVPFSVSGSSTSGYGSFAITQAGVWTYTPDYALTAWDALDDGNMASDVFTIAVTFNGVTLEQDITLALTGANEPLAFTVDDLDDQQYIEGVMITNLTLPQATGGDGDYTYRASANNSLFAGASGGGLRFNGNTRVISGTPTTPNSYTVTYRVTDGGGATTFLRFAITVTADTTPVFADGVTIPGQEYIAGFAITTLTLPQAGGGNGALSYTLGASADGTLPAGLTFDADSRELSGTPSTPQGATDYTYTVTDSDATGPDSATLAFTIEVTSPPVLSAIVGEFAGAVTEDGAASATGMVQGTEADGTAIPGVPFSVSGSSTSDYGSFAITPAGVWTYTPDYALTAWDALDDGNMASDVFTIAVTFNGVTLEQNITLALTGANEPLAFTVDDLDNQQYIEGVMITDLTLPQATGGDGDYTYRATANNSLFAGASGGGLRFRGNTRVISGTPTTPNSYTVTYRVTDGGGATTFLRFDIIVMADTAPAFADGVTIPDQQYIAGFDIFVPTPQATGGNGALSYTLVDSSGNLLRDGPTGLRFISNPLNPRIQGTPIVAQDATDYTYTVTDANGDTATLTFTIEVMAMVLTTIRGTTSATLTEPGGTVFGTLRGHSQDAGSVPGVTLSGVIFRPAASSTGTTDYGIFTIFSNGAWQFTPDYNRPAWDALAAGRTTEAYTVEGTLDGVTLPATVTITLVGIVELTVIPGSEVRDLQVAVRRQGRRRRPTFVSWLPPATVSGANPVTSYTVQGCRMASLADCATLVTEPHNPAPPADRQEAVLDSSTHPHFRVRAIFSDDRVSPWVSAMRPAGNPPSLREPGAIRNLAASGITDTGVTLSWDAPATGTIGLRSYLVRRGFPSAPGSRLPFLREGQVDLADQSARTYTDSGLLPGTEYLYEVVADNSQGGIGPAVLLPVTTTGTAPPPVVISGTSSGDVTEVGTITGKLDITVIGAESTDFVPVSGRIGTYGTFSIDSDGMWEYAANNSPATRALRPGDEVMDVFTVVAAADPEVTQDVTITIIGVNTRPNVIIILLGRTVEAGQTLSIAGARTDPDNEPGELTVVWSAQDSAGNEVDDSTFSNPAGVGIEWTPPLDAIPGEYVLEVIVADPGGLFDRQTLRITVTASPLSFGTASVADQNYPLNTVITDLTLPAAIGGAGPYSYALPDPPSGLTFDGGTRILSGTPDTVQAATTHTYTATDSATSPAMATLEFTIEVEAPASSDADLSALTLSAGKLTPVFDSATLAYMAMVDNSVSSLTLTPTAADDGASITVDGVAVESSTASDPVDLDVGPNAIDVVVTAEDGASTVTYTVTVTRAAAAPPAAMIMAVNPSVSGPLSEANLDGSTVLVTLSNTDFVASTSVIEDAANYRVNGLAGLTIRTAGFFPGTSVVPARVLIEIAYDGTDFDADTEFTITVLDAVHTGTGDLTTGTGMGTTVTAIDETSRLSALSLSEGALTPVFDAGTFIYTASVANSINSLTVTPAAATGTTITVNSVAVNSGEAGAALDLTTGANTITVAVTAPRADAQTYTLTVTRAQPLTISGTNTGAVTEDDTATASNTLAIANPNPSGVTTFVEQTGTDGAYGLFEITSAGVWTYTLGGNMPNEQAVNALAAGATPTDVFTVVASADSSVTQDVTITVNGANDAPTAAISEPTDGTAVEFGVAIQVIGTGTDPDAGQTAALTYAWTASPDVGSFANANVASTMWTAPASGTDPVTLTLTVTDDDATTPLTGTAQVTVNPVGPATATISPATLTEAALNGATLTVTLTNTEYEPNPAPGQFTLTLSGGATGISVGSVNRVSATVATLTLAYTGTGVDADTTIAVTVADAAHTGAGDLITATPVAVTATPAPVLSIAAPTTNPAVLSVSSDSFDLIAVVTNSGNAPTAEATTVNFYLLADSASVTTAADLGFSAASGTIAAGIAASGGTGTLTRHIFGPTSGAGFYVLYACLGTVTDATLATDCAFSRFLYDDRIGGTTARADKNAGIVVAARTETSRITYPDDSDWFSFILENGALYRIDLTSANATLLNIRDNAGAVVSRDLIAGGANTRQSATYTAAADGRHFIEVVDNGGGPGGYTLVIRRLVGPVPELSIAAAPVVDTAANTLAYTVTNAGTEALVSAVAVNVVRATSNTALTGTALTNALAAATCTPGSGAAPDPCRAVIDGDLSAPVAAGDGTTDGTLAQTITALITPSDGVEYYYLVCVTVGADAACSPYSAAAATDIAPDFGAASIGALSYPATAPITPLTLPIATGGNGELAYRIVETLPTGLTFDNAMRALSGTPATMAALANFTYIVSDADTNTAGTDEDTLAFSITITAAPPATFGGVATGSVTEDSNLTAAGALTITHPGSGSTDVVAQTNTDGTYGLFGIGADGEWTYTLGGNPANDDAVNALHGRNGGETQMDTFTVTAVAGGTQDVVITITGANDAPTAAISAPAAGNVEFGVAIPATGSGTDPDTGDTLSYAWTTNPAGQGAFANANVASTMWTAPDSATAAGSVDLILTVSDNATPPGTDTTQVRVTPVVPAVALAGETTGVVTEDGTTTADGTLTITTASSDRAVLVQSATGTYGSLSITGLVWTYTLTNTNAATNALAAGVMVDDTFTITASANPAASVTVTITITGANDAPTVAISAPLPNAQVNFGEMLTLTATGEDVDSSTLTYAWTANPDVGSFANAAAASTTWTAPASGTAPVTLTLTVMDDATPRLSDTAAVTVNPVAVAITFGGATTGDITEGATTPITGTLTVTSTGSNTNVVAQTAVSGTYGTFAIAANGVWTYTLDNTNSAINPLAAGATLDDPFTVTAAANAAATVVITITITGVNDAPTAAISAPAAGNVEFGVAIPVTGSGTDPDTTDVLTYAWTTSPANQGVFANANAASTTWTAPDSAAGSVDLILTVSDNATPPGTDTTQVRVTPVVPAVALAGETTGVVTEDAGTITATGTLTITTNSNDRAVTIQSATGTYGSLSITGLDWTYTLDNADTDTNALAAGVMVDDTFTITASANSAASVTVTITITGANDAPTAAISAPAAGNVEFGVAIPVTGSGTDPDTTDVLTYAWTTSPANQGAFANANAANTTWTAPDSAPAAGSVDLILTVSDNATPSGTDTAQVTVNPVVPAVALAGETTGVVTEDGTTTADGTLTITTASSDQAVLVQSATGTYGSLSITGLDWTYTLDNADTDTNALAAGVMVDDTFTITANANPAASVTVTITITGANDAPTVAISAPLANAQVNFGEMLTLTATGEDVDSSNLTYAWTANPDVGSFANAAAASTTWTAPASGTAPVTLTLTVMDDATPRLSDTAAVTVNPVAVAITFGGATTGDINEGDTTPITGNLTVGSSGSNTNVVVQNDQSSIYGTYSVTTAGRWTYTLDNTNAAINALAAGATLDDPFTVTAAANAAATVVITITITGVNDAPTAAISAPAAGNVEFGVAIPVTGSGTDPDTTDTLSYAWTTNPGGQGSFANANAADTTWTAPDSGGAITLILTVSDDASPPATDTAQVRVTPVVPAVALAGETTGVVTEDGTTTADGTLTITTASNDRVVLVQSPTGTYGSLSITGLAWTYTLDNADTDTNALAAGVMVDDTFTITASANSAATVDVVITITGANDAPTVAISAPLANAQVNFGEMLTLTATGEDVDSSTLTYEWSASPDVGSFANAAAASTTWTAPASGTAPVTLTLTVTDDDATTPLTATAQVTVNPVDPPLAGLSVVRDLAVSERLQGSRPAVFLAWQAPAMVPSGVTITGYEIQSCRQNDFSDCTTQITVAGVGAVLRFEPPPRHWRVRALTAGGFSPWAEASLDAFTPSPTVAPGPVRDLASSGITDTGVTLTWLAPDVDADGMACVDFNDSPCGAGYVVRRGFPDGETPPGLILDPAPVEVSIGSLLTYTDAALLPGTTYLYEVYATNSALSGAPVRLAVTTTGTPGTIPTTITGDDTGAVTEGDGTAEVMLSGDLDDSSTAGDDNDFVLDEGTIGLYGTFTIGTDGGWVYTLIPERALALNTDDMVDDVFTVTATAPDAAGLTVTHTVTITVTGVNSPPNGLILVTDTTVEVGGTIVLGGGATDPDDRNTALTVEWTANGGTLINPVGAGIEWVATNGANSYTLTQTVTDPGGLFDTQDVTITVTGASPAAAITNIPLHEEALNGATMTVALINTQYENTLTPGLFTLDPDGRFTGLTVVGSVARTDATTATLTLAYTGSISSGADTELSVTVTNAAHTGSDDLTARSTLTVNADVAPTFGATTPIALTFVEAVPITPTRLPGATGGNGALTYSIAPSLPLGLALNPVTRFLTGTPTAGQTATTYTYTVTDSDPVTPDRADFASAFSIAVISIAGPEATITSPATLALDEAALDGAALTVTLADTEYETPLEAGQFTLTLTDGATGISVGSVTRDSATAATLTLAYGGTGVDADTTIAVTVTAAAHTGTGDLTTLNSVAVTATDIPPAFADGASIGDQTYTAGTAIPDLTLPIATGGNGGLTYALAPTAGGNLPDGLAFDDTTRVLSGNPATMQAAAEYTYTATDADTNQADSDADTLTFMITINAAGSLAIGGDLAGTVVEASTRIDQSGDTSTPGTPTATGTATVVDAGGNAVAGATFTPATTDGNFGGFVIDAGGGWTYTLDNVRADELRETPGGGDSDTFAVTGNSGGDTITGTVTITITGVNDWPVFVGIEDPDRGAHIVSGPLTGATVSFAVTYRDPDVARGDVVTAVFEGDGTFTVTARTATTLTITWMVPPVDRETVYFPLLRRLTDSAGAQTAVDESANATIVPEDLTPAFADDASIDDQTWDVGETITPLTLPEATGGNRGLRYSIRETLPSGLTFTAATRILSGTPDTAADATFTYVVTDNDDGVNLPNDEDTLTFTITADIPPAFAGGASIGALSYPATVPLTPLTLPGATGGNGELAYRIVETLPTGLTFDNATRVLSGTPATMAGLANFTYAVSDADTNTAATDEDTLAFSITITAAPPATFGGVATGSVTEDSNLTAAGALTITHPGSGSTDVVAQTNTDGTYGLFGIGADGEWTYTLGGNPANDDAVNALHGRNGGETQMDTFTVTAVAGGTQDVVITITGANDAPTAAISAPAAGNVEFGVAIQVTGSGTDPDTGDTLSYAWTTNPANQGVFANANAASTMWTAPDSATAAGSVDLILTVSDNATPSGTDTTQVRVTPVVPAVALAGETTGVVTEDGTTTADGTLTITTASNDRAVTIQSPTGTYGSLSITGLDWTYTLDNADTDTNALAAGVMVDDTFTITASANSAASVTVTITITGANDAPTAAISAPAAGNVEFGVAIPVTGSGTDPDTTDTLTYAWTTNPAGQGTFANANAASTMWTAPDSATGSVDLILTVSDNATPPGTDTTQVTVNPVVPAVALAGETTGVVTEDGTTTATGTLTLDTNSNDRVVLVQSATGTYGSLSITGLVWTYTLDNADTDTNALAAGVMVDDTFTITANANPAASVTVTITITGANDAPTAGITAPPASTMVSFAGMITVTGTGADPDTGDTANLTYAWTTVPANAGSFADATVASTTWTAPDSAMDVMLNLQVTDSSNTAAAAPPVTVMVVPVAIVGTTTGSVTEDGDLTAGGDLDIDNPAGNANFMAANEDGTYGAFTIATNGNWTYTLNNAAAQALAAGAAPTETFTATSAIGGGTQVITITVNGVNDAPTVAISEPTPDAQVEFGVAIQVTGTGTDPDTGQTATLTYEWTTNPANRGSFTNAAIASTTWTAPNTGTADVILILEVDDGTATDTARVTVRPRAAPVTIAGGNTGGVTEDGALTATGTLTVSNPNPAPGDSTAVLAPTETSRYGTFVIGLATGVWTYTLDNADNDTDALAAGDSPTETFTIRTVADPSVMRVVTITITGANDAPTASITTPAPALSSTFNAVPGRPVALEATGEDVDTGTTLTYAWTTNPANQGTFANAANANTTWNPPIVPADTAVTLILTVADNAASNPATATATFALTVTEGPAVGGPGLEDSDPNTADRPGISDATINPDGESISGGRASGRLTVINIPTDQTTGQPAAITHSILTQPTYGIASIDDGVLTSNVDDVWNYVLDNNRDVTKDLGRNSADLPIQDTFVVQTRVGNDIMPITSTITVTFGPDTFPDDRPEIVFADGPSMTVDEGEEDVTLDAGLTYDPENRDAGITGLTFVWTQNVDDEVRVTLSGDNTATATFTAPDERTTLHFDLMVTDSTGVESTATLIVRVGRSSERALQKTLAAFGRAFATGTVGMFEDYLSTPARTNTSSFTIGGHKFDMATDPAQTSPSFGNPVEHDPTQPANLADTINSANLDDTTTNGAGTDTPAATTTTLMSGQDLLMKSAFHLNLNDPTGTTSTSWSFWGRATTGNFNGDTDNADAGEEISVDGSVDSGYLGIDYLTPAGTRLGLAIAQSDGEIDYDEVTGGNTTSGDLEAEMTSILPYIQWQPGESTNAWLLLGYGKGDAEISIDGDADATDVDIDMQMLAFGLRGDLDRAFSRTELSWKASAFAITIESDDQPDLGGVEADSQRLRFAVEGRRPGATSATGGVFTPGWELGMRWEDGDIERGTAADAGLRFDYTNPTSGWSLSGTSTFVLFSPEAYDEWTAGLQARIDPGAQGRGITFTLEPGWTKDGRTQQMGMDFSNALGKWTARGLQLQLTGERTERDDDDIGHNIRLTGSLRF